MEELKTIAPIDTCRYEAKENSLLRKSQDQMIQFVNYLNDRYVVVRNFAHESSTYHERKHTLSGLR